MKSIFEGFITILSSVVFVGLVGGLVLIFMIIIKKTIAPYLPELKIYFETTTNGKIIYNFLILLLVIVCAIILYELYIFLLPSFDYLRFVTILLFVFMIVGGIAVTVVSNFKNK